MTNLTEVGGIEKPSASKEFEVSESGGGLHDLDDEFEVINEEDFNPFCLTPETEAEILKILDSVADQCDGEVDKSTENVVRVIVKLCDDVSKWRELRQETIDSLRAIAEYIDTITKRSAFVKAVGSGSGILAGTLTLAGGILTILSAGAALPVLLAGTGLGLAAGVTGGTAAITESIIKSQQMKAAKLALEADHAATLTLETTIAVLRRNQRLIRQVASHAIISGSGVISGSVKLAGLITGNNGLGTLEAGVKAAAQLLGEDIGKTVSKILLHTSGRVLTGAVTIVFSGATVAYDIYKLNEEVQTLAGKGSQGAADLRHIADQLESALNEFLEKESTLDDNPDQFGDDVTTPTRTMDNPPSYSDVVCADPDL